MVLEFYRHHEILPISPEDKARFIQDYKNNKKADLITAAAFARDNAVSYRNFKVGAAIMSKEPNQASGEYSIYSGHNYKPEKNLRKKTRLPLRHKELTGEPAFVILGKLII